MASKYDKAYTPLAYYGARTVATIKVKSSLPWDFYVCEGCNQRWRSSDKKIGHTPATCARRQIS